MAKMPIHTSCAVLGKLELCLGLGFGLELGLGFGFAPEFIMGTHTV